MKPETKISRAAASAYTEILSAYKQAIEAEKMKQESLHADPVTKYARIFMLVQELESINPFAEEMVEDIAALYEMEELMACEYFKAYVFNITNSKKIDEIERKLKEMKEYYSFVPEVIMDTLNNVSLDDRYELSDRKGPKI